MEARSTETEVVVTEETHESMPKSKAVQQSVGGTTKKVTDIFRGSIFDDHLLAVDNRIAAKMSDEGR